MNHHFNLSQDAPTPTRRFTLKRILINLVLLIGITAGGGFLLAKRWYDTNLQPVSANSDQAVQITIAQGTSAASIAQLLEDEGVIKSAAAFNWYLRLNNLSSSLQAGEYSLSPAQTVAQVVEAMGDGKVASSSFTIVPGKRLDQLEETFAQAGYSSTQVEEALNPNNYIDHPVAAYKPAEASLEGYLYPETFEIADTTTAVELVTKALDELDKALTPQLISQLEDQGLSVHDAVILASIVEKEVSNSDDKPKVAQVFLKRLREGIILGSDVTFFYASAVFGGRASPSLDNPYNTRLYGGLPPGPISNFSIDTLEALAKPSDTEYLYFVAGDNGTTYFNETLAGHNRDAATYCIELCKLP